VDLTLVTNQGTRVSWLGGRRDTVGADATTVGRESLALGRAVAGSYVLEVTRPEPASDRPPVKGTVEIEVLGTDAEVPFELRGESTRVARIVVERKSRLAVP
jgi:hypothetical protein